MRRTVMTFVVEENLSKRINALRFLLIVFVVFIHNSIIETGVNFSNGRQVFDVPLYVMKIKELAGTFTDIAVPLFFLISGYLLYVKEPSFIINIKKKCRTILVPYILWTILVLIFLFVAQNFNFTKQYFATTIIKDFTAIDWVDAFIGKFTAMRKYTYPLVFQFWFLRDLFILNLLFPVIKAIIDKVPGGTFVLFFILWISGINIYIVETSALFFFSLGYYIVKYKINYRYIDNIKTFDICSMYGLTIICSLFFNEKIAIIGYINIIVGIMFFIKCSFNLIKNDNVYNILLRLERYAFWVYATHGIVLAVMIKLGVKIMPMTGGWLLVHYFVVALLCIIILVGVGVIFKRLLPKTYGVLTGGRI